MDAIVLQLKPTGEAAVIGSSAHRPHTRPHTRRQQAPGRDQYLSGLHLAPTMQDLRQAEGIYTLSSEQLISATQLLTPDM